MKHLKMVIPFAIVIFIFSSCATIIGGHRYRAHVNVNDHPDAIIKYKGMVVGQGSASFKVPRSEANKLEIKVKEQNCEEQTFEYTKRSFRGWAFVGTLVTFTSVYYIPYGAIIDLANGALWKPDVHEKGVYKMNYNNFNYSIDYTGCEGKEIAPNSDKK
jgi:hypothetical protein